MKKRLNIFCVLMFLLLAAQVVMTFVTGADAFAEGWREGASAGAESSWGGLLETIAGLVVVIAAFFSFGCFVNFILNINRNKVFVWDNVLLLRRTGIGLFVVILLISVCELFNGKSFTAVYDNYFDVLIFCVFNLIVAEAFAIGLKLKEEQELTI